MIRHLKRSLARTSKLVVLRTAIDRVESANKRPVLTVIDSLLNMLLRGALAVSMTDTGMNTYLTGQYGRHASYVVPTSHANISCRDAHAYDWLHPLYR